MNEYLNRIKEKQETWLVTGAAGFIGGNLVEELLKLNQIVYGIDNFSNGFRENLIDIKSQVTQEQWNNFHFIEGDICDLDLCEHLCNKATYVLHNAALNSVPRSIDDPLNTNQSNITGFLTMLVAAKDANVKRFVYAASSSTYGDHAGLPKKEETIGMVLSPYAVSKYVNELYANVFPSIFGLDTIGLRYFNVFGKRQNPNLTYAAVIPKWAGMIMKGERPIIFGDGETTRDFCYVKNVVQANLLAATEEKIELKNRVMNIAYGQQTTLTQLFEMLRSGLEVDVAPIYKPFREGDIRHSLADISRAKRLIGYDPAYPIRKGLKEFIEWFKVREDY